MGRWVWWLGESERPPRRRLKSDVRRGRHPLARGADDEARLVDFSRGVSQRARRVRCPPPTLVCVTTSTTTCALPARARPPEPPACPRPRRQLTVVRRARNRDNKDSARDRRHRRRLRLGRPRKTTKTGRAAAPAVESELVFTRANGCESRRSAIPSYDIPGVA